MKEASVKEELTCITCPLGCRLEAEKGPDGSLALSGNRCQRGAAYAREELLSPKRVVTATCRIASRASGRAEGSPRRISCKTSAPFPKERVGELLAAIYRIEVELPVERGRILLADALGSGIDLVATRSVK
jgi:CxxC motif-containing protein